MSSTRLHDPGSRDATRTKRLRSGAPSARSRRLRARVLRAERALRLEHERRRTCEERLRDTLDEHRLLSLAEQEIRAEAGALAAELADQREWLEAVLDRMPTPLGIVEIGTGRVAFSNKAADAMWGEPSADGAWPAQGFCTDDEGRRLLDDERPIARAARGDAVFGEQIEYHGPFGKKSLVVDMSVMPPFAGRRAMAVVAFQEITGLKEAESALKESERQFRMLADMVPPLVWKAAPEGDITYLNRRWVEYAGREAEHFGWGWTEMLHPGDAPALLARWKQCLSTGDDYEAWARLRRHDGVYRWHLCRARPLRDEDGRIVAWFGTCTDIEDQKRAEAELEALLAAAPVGIGVLDRQLRWLRINRTLAALHGGPPEDHVGRSVEEALPELAPTLVPIFRRVIDTGEPLVNAELTSRGHGGRADRHWLVNYFPVRVEGEVVGLAAIFVDFTERKRAERALEDANRIKDEFLATMSHELRTPLTAVLGWTRMLRSTALPESKRERALESIERNAQAQARLIEDLLDVSRIVSGKLRLNVAPVELVPVVESALEAVRPASEAKGIGLRVFYDPEVGAILGDADRLRQVVWNLLVNAVKFTPSGGHVALEVRRVSTAFVISVTDTGQGIRADFLPHVFERFRQADASTTRAQGGLGLGLSVAHQLVELHGGTIDVASEGPGKGASFTVRLPVAPMPALTPPEGTRLRHGAPLARLPQLHGVRVLVVDDEPDTRSLVASVLEHCKAEVATASSVAEALELMRKGQHDVLLSDIGMPTEDGFSLIRSVRALTPEQGGGIPAVALTAYARVEDRTRAMRAGFNLHVPKPIDPAELLVVVANITGRSPPDE